VALHCLFEVLPTDRADYGHFAVLLSLSSPEGREEPYLVPVGKDRLQAVALADVPAVDEDPHPYTAVFAKDARP